MTKFVGVRPKTYSYLIDGSSEDERDKNKKQFLTKRNPKFQYYKNCLEANQPDNEINLLGKNKIDIDSFTKRLKRIHKKTIN